MKTALFEGEEIEAAADAPEEAACPDCGKRVELRFLERGGSKSYYYRHCQEKPTRQTADPERVQGDPLLVVASTAVERTIEAARSGDLSAILGLAFSPLVHRTLTLIDLSPEEVLDIVVPGGEMGAAELIGIDPEAASRVTWEGRAPVFDLSPEPDGYGRELEASDCYVPLPTLGPWQARMMQQILKRTQRAYLIGGSDEWRDVLRAPRFGR